MANTDCYIVDIYDFRSQKSHLCRFLVKKRPSQVGLAHEMIHGDRSMRGVAIEYSESESYSYMNNRGQRVMETLSKEEAATVGLNHVKKNDITENDIRKDQGLNPRGAY